MLSRHAFFQPRTALVLSLAVASARGATTHSPHRWRAPVKEHHHASYLPCNATITAAAALTRLPARQRTPNITRMVRDELGATGAYVA
jgi:hypothetical protein